MTDPWGIESRYQDALGRWHAISDETRTMLLEAMGADLEKPPAESSVMLVHPRVQVCLIAPGELTLESGERFRVADELPRDLPHGYHTLRSEADGAVSHIICGPGECWLPDDLKLWGWAVQLYAARSGSSWGIGDLGDLKRLAEWSSSKLDAGLVLVNPLSAATPLAKQQSSPYYPSSRRFRNPIYIRVQGAPNDLDQKGRALNESRRIDRDAAYRLKMEALRAQWETFGGDSSFDRFCEVGGDDLQEYATFCVLAEHYNSGWHGWPEEHRHPRNADVLRFASDHSLQVDFHKWLQWLLDKQLGDASKSLALMQDLPIGFDPSGADGWAWQDLFARNVGVGAPPDEFNTQGQDWGLPPFVPHKLRAAGYKPFIDTVRSCLRHAGGLRIDHVMGLFRLFWIPAHAGAANGAYVRYRADELLAILALESHRAKAFVVGEDLGTTEEGVREMLQAHKVLSYRLLWFEKERPSTYPEMALAAITTHDLPTVAGLWTGSDLAAQKKLGLKPNEAGVLEQKERLREMTGLADAAPIATVITSAYALLNEAPCRIVTAALDDALAVEERPNMPATIDEWPNWSIALPKTLEEIEQEPLAQEIARVLRR